MLTNDPLQNTTLTRPNSSKTRQDSKAETRRLLMKAGRDLFAEKGFTETYAGEIAQRAGMAVGTIYLHFGDKEGLLARFCWKRRTKSTPASNRYTRTHRPICRRWRGRISKPSSSTSRRIIAWQGLS